jgi:hypothetical protein
VALRPYVRGFRRYARTNHAASKSHLPGPLDLPRMGSRVRVGDPPIRTGHGNSEPGKASATPNRRQQLGYRELRAPTRGDLETALGSDGSHRRTESIFGELPVRLG